MKTIHIYGVSLRDPYLKQWYREFLKDDPKFHYVYWENGDTHKARIVGKNILVRLEKQKVIKKLKDWLDRKDFSYDEYNYPYTKKKYHLGLFKRSWEDRHFEISQMLDSVCSRAALELNEKDWGRFLQQLFHIACNTRARDHYMQVEYMIWLLQGSLRTYRSWAIGGLEKIYKEANEKKT